MTPPRQIHPGQLCFVTTRAVNRCHRFAPTAEVVEILWYCLAYTLSRFRGRIEAHDFLWMSNHYHLVLTDRAGCLPDFMTQLNSLMARSLNALYGISGTAIEKGYNLVEITTEGRVVDHCAYTLANPCSAHLVERSHHWRSVSSHGLDYGRSVTVKKPTCGLWGGPCRHRERANSQRSKRARHGGRSRLPESIELVLTRPRIMPELSDTELRRHIHERVGQREDELIAERRKSRARVKTWRSLTRTSPTSAPKTSEELFGTVPSFSAETRDAWLSAWRRRREFLERYYEALRRFIRGDAGVEFPAGTWLMRRRFSVVCCAVA